MKPLSAFKSMVLETEERLLETTRVRERLTQICSTPEGLRAFGESFYFIRYHFVKVNFLVGARVGAHERNWKGLVENLQEELGGEHGVAHNELYRWFLQSVGFNTEEELKEPAFARAFNELWENYSLSASPDAALSAVAVYEVLDNPDYQLLLDLMREAGVDERGLIFFDVHAKAEHFEMFEDFGARMLATQEGTEILSSAASFVNKTQGKMWHDLLVHLEKQPGCQAQ